MITGPSRRRARPRARSLALVATLVCAGGSAAYFSASPGASADGPKPSLPTTSPTAKTSPIAKPIAKGGSTAPQYVTLYCRGPFLLGAGPVPQISARKGDSAAGDVGDALDPGECALRDRKLAGSERADVFFDYSENSGKAMFVSGVSPALATCALNSDCVVRALVRLGDNGYWRVKPNESVWIMKHGTPHS